MKIIFTFLFLSLFSFSQSLNYDYSVTFGNHVIAINEINYDFQEGDLIGCFFINSIGDLQCCGSVSYNNQELIYISVWPDDPFSPEQEGFYDGDQIILSFYLCNNEEYISSYGSLYFNDTLNSLNQDEISFVTNGLSILEVFIQEPPNCDSYLVNQENHKKLIKIFNFLGQVIDSNNLNFPSFVLYDDGTVEKKLFFR